ncbi:hypothetical protein TRAPUB_7015 [Trametes pubescens]|uniref:Uncharacterized protein n=1 Tax=Trametes pubescens TaxID=154538 RepID=A0A1M2V4D1_TRAPU|nr:hypothetical protein TRAPUB_7015 [Trametes pubescens]
MAGDTMAVQNPSDRVDDTEWEDIPETNLARYEAVAPLTPRSGSVTSSAPGTPRTGARRRRGIKAGTPIVQPQFIATQPRRANIRPQQIQRQRNPTRPVIAIDREDVQDALIHGTAETVRYLGGVLTHALRLLRWPFGILLALWLLGFIVARISETLRPIVTPFCIIPGISGSTLCRAPQVLLNADGEPVPLRADYPELVKIQSSNFEELLDGAVGGSGLSLEIKKAEMASKDLITLVKFSQLKSKDLLAESLFEFVEDAKMTGRGLQKLTSKVNGAVDKIMAINDYALRTIEGAQDEPKSVLQVIWPFASPPSPPSQDLVVAAFRDSMDVHAAEMRRLVLELDVSEKNLDRLDVHLGALHDLCTRENVGLTTVREDLLAELWTILGGNKRRLRGIDGNLELLRDLGEYRKRAAAHVAAAKQTIMAMGEDMEDLRERVAAPDIVGDRIPVEVHMRSIQSGLERLKEDRIKAREREEQLMNRILGTA